MAVNSRISIENLRQASEYFNSLLKEHWKDPEDSFIIEDERMGAMLKEAAYASAVIFGQLYDKRFFTKLEENGIKVPEAVVRKTNPSHVMKMCASYESGKRNFDRYGLDSARNVCETVLNHVYILNKERAKV